MQPGIAANSRSPGGRLLAARSCCAPGAPAATNAAAAPRLRAACAGASRALRRALLQAAGGAALVAGTGGAAPADAATVNWVADSDGLWHEAYRWSTGNLPGPADDVIIDRPSGDYLVIYNQGNQVVNTLLSNERFQISGGTFTVTTSAQFNNAFTLSAATLTGPGNVVINSTGTWIDASVMSGSGTTIVSTNGTFTILKGTYQKQLQRNIENFGTVNWVTDEPGANVNLFAVSLFNRPGATFNLNNAADGVLYGAQSGTGVTPSFFFNEGTLNKNGTGTATFGGDQFSQPVTVINTGTVYVNAGRLVLQFGGTHTGEFRVSAGASLRFEGGHAFGGGAGITAAGDVTFVGGNNSAAGPVDVGGTLRLSGGSAAFNAALNAATLLVSNGATVSFNGTATLATATFQDNALISGVGDIFLNGPATWSGGGLMNGPGRTVVAAGTTLTLNPGTSAKTIGRRIDNHGTLVWNGAGAAASLNLANAQLNNFAGATFDIAGDQYALNAASGTSLLSNAGLITKAGGTGTTAIAIGLLNSGTVSVSAGTLTIDGGFTNTGRLAVAGATLAFPQGLGNNTGTIDVGAGGVLNVGGTNTTAHWATWRSTAGGQVNLLGTLDNTAAALALTADTGPLRMLAGSQVVGGSLSTTGGAVLHAVGAATLDGVALAGPVTLRLDTNLAVANGLSLSGDWTVSTDQDRTVTFLGAQPSITGTGTIVPAGSAGTTLTLGASAGATLTLGPGIVARPAPKDLVVGAPGAALVTQGTMLADVAGRTLTLAGSSVDNQGLYDVKNGATLRVSGTSLNVAGGILSGGTWRVSDGGTLRVQGANLTAIAAPLLLDGPGAQFYSGTNNVSALANLTQVAPAGDFTISSERTFTTVSSFTNLGRLTVGDGSAWTTPGAFINTGTVAAAGSLAATTLTNDGTFTASGGTHTVSGAFVVGQTRPAASYTLAGGTLAVGGYATIGSGAAGGGQFVQAGGQFSVAKALIVSTTTTNAASVTVSDGALSAGEISVAAFGSATGLFSQSGGTVTVAAGSSGLSGQLLLAVSSLPATTGTYALSGGALADQGATVGWGTTGNFNHSGGTHTVSNPATNGASGLILGYLQSGKGTYALSGDAVLAVTPDEHVGYLGTGTLNQAGGTHTVAGTLYVGTNPGATGTVNLSGGSLAADAVQLLRGTFNQAGGTLNATAFLHAGGTVAGTLQNQGTYTYASGAFTGRLLNQGAVALNANLTLGDGLDNRTTFTVAAGRSVSANGAGLANAGTLTVAGGTFAASLAFNHGTFVQSAGSSALGAVSGTGSVTVDGGTLAASSVRQDSLAIGNAAVVALSAGGPTSAVKSLAISATAGAALDLNDNALVVDYTGPSALQAVRDLVLSGRNPANGTGAAQWNGPGLRSAAAAANPAGLAIGFTEAADALGLSGTATATWRGVEVDSSAVLVRTTLPGDADLDGAVAFADLLLVAQNYDQAFGAAAWGKGDFDYDGAVGFADLLLVAQNYDAALPGPAALPAAGASFNDDWALALATVPEPGTAALLAMGLAAPLLRRRRRHA